MLQACIEQPMAGAGPGAIADQIADQLVLSEKSVENQINIIYQQLEVRSEQSAMQPRVRAVLTYLEESRGRGG